MIWTIKQPLILKEVQMGGIFKKLQWSLTLYLANRKRVTTSEGAERKYTSVNI